MKKKQRWIGLKHTADWHWQVLTVAKDCGCKRSDAFLALFNLFAWLDNESQDGLVLADKNTIDYIAELPGCASSLERNGWLSFDKKGRAAIYAADCFVLPKLERYYKQKAMCPTSKNGRKRGAAKQGKNRKRKMVTK